MKKKITKKVTYKAWRSYKSWIRKNQIRGNQIITNYEEFKEVYKNLSGQVSRGPLAKIKEISKYQMTSETWTAANERYKEITGKYIPTKYRSLSTQQIAALMQPEMEETYRDALDKGLTKAQARYEVSRFYFGS